MWQVLRSLNVAHFLMGFMALLLLYGFFLPITDTLLFYLLLVLVTINLTFCTVYRFTILFSTKPQLFWEKLGSGIFHASLLILFLGGGVSKLTRFEGYVELGEGQFFRDEERDYQGLKKGLWFEHRGFGIMLNKVSAFTEFRDKTKPYASEITVFDPSGNKVMAARISPANPAYYGGYGIFQGRSFGPALLFRFVSNYGTASTGYVNLTLPAKAGEEAAADFTIPLAFADASLRLDTTPHHSLSLVVRSQGKILKEGNCQVGSTVSLPSGKLYLLALNKWTGLTIVYDDGAWYILAGFILGTLGLAIMGISYCSSKIQDGGLKEEKKC